MLHNIIKRQSFFFCLFLSVVFGGCALYAQSDFQKIQYKHVAFKLPGTWTVKNHQDRGGDYSIICKQGDIRRVEVYCINDKVNLQNLLFKHTGLLKKEPNMEYLSIDEEESFLFQKREAIKIGVHNQYLTDFYQGEFVAFHENGRTFVVFWFTKDSQKSIEPLRKAVETLQIKK